MVNDEVEHRPVFADLDQVVRLPNPADCWWRHCHLAKATALWMQMLEEAWVFFS
jgi:hypothetical protein